MILVSQVQLKFEKSNKELKSSKLKFSHLQILTNQQQPYILPNPAFIPQASKTKINKGNCGQVFFSVKQSNLAIGIK